MNTNILKQLNTLGQSLWYDNIQRRLLENGELAGMIARGEIRGVTSNPSIFHNAIAKSSDYDPALVPLAWSGWNAEQIFWQLAYEDIRAACDLFLPLYKETDGGDGYVSLEVSPYLANETEATLEQAKHLWQTVDRPNLMIKIPATKAGLPAIRGAIAAGINVNVTLIFSIERYHEVMDAYLSGLEDHLKANNPRRVASVASFFVSRLDSKVDAMLPEGSPLCGKAAVANTKLAYEAFCKVFSESRFGQLQQAGAYYQRPLWASTSTKNPAYPDTLYVDELIGPATVNTVPPQTLVAFLDHGKVEEMVTRNLDAARQVFADLEAAGISMAQVTQELEEEGVKAFADAFTALLKTIEERRQNAAAQLGPLQAPVTRRVSHLAADAVPSRIWEHDASLWTQGAKAQDEICKRLGWLDLPQTSRKYVKEIKSFAEEVRQAGIKKILLLGMGGSSLAPEVFSLTFPVTDVQFAILDSTDPTQVSKAMKEFPPEESLYIVSSKSGGTAEVMAMLDTFWDLAKGDGSCFVAITDPGTSLDALANARGFRKTFLADPTVGGRFSALSHFGLVPAALMGLDIDAILAPAEWMMKQCAAAVPAPRNPGLVLGAILGQAAADGRDKLTLIVDDFYWPFGAWLEQLIAESTGKDGTGIIVVDDEPMTVPDSEESFRGLDVYGDDRLFVYLRSSGKHEAAVAYLRQASHPVLEFAILDPQALLPEFYRWEFATMVAGHILGVNAFDQPDVQDSKDRTNAKVKAYKATQKLDEGEPTCQVEDVKAYTDLPLAGNSLAEILDGFLGMIQNGDYLAINAYLPRQANSALDVSLKELRSAILFKYRCATTLGYGPRFLHSTGQLHKGGPDSGLFLQITADPAKGLEIPGQGLTFGTLQRAQALGDYEALAARKRRILRLHFPYAEMIKELVKAV